MSDYRRTLICWPNSVLRKRAPRPAEIDRFEDNGARMLAFLDEKIRNDQGFLHDELVEERRQLEAEIQSIRDEFGLPTPRG